MTRMSRRLTVGVAILIAIAMNTFFAYMAFLNHRLSSEILNSPWRNPTIITSNATGLRDTEIVRVYGADWRASRPVSMKSLPPHVANAFIAAEDIRFRRHLGIDPIGIGRALFANVRRGGIAQGGSTIDQQLIKSRFFSNERTYRRKIVEVLLAVVLDARMSKDDILEGYLNDVYLGHVNGRSLLGIDEASKVFFNKPAEKLSVAEAALIAGIVRAPNRDTPDRRPDHARARRNAILKEMREHKWITEDDYQRSVRRSVDLRPGVLPDEPYPYYLSALRSEVVEAVGNKPLLRGGLRVVCEMDPSRQRAAEQAVRLGVRSLVARYPWIREQSRKEPLQAALLSVDPLTGGIRALVGGADFARTTFDRTRNMRRQPGSAFKTFAFASAIASKEATNATLLMDTPVRIELASNETWEPRNYDGRFRGRVTVREAFEKSLNVPAVRLAQEIGIKRVIDMAGKFGFGEEFPEIPALPLRPGRDRTGHSGDQGYLFAAHRCAGHHRSRWPDHLRRVPDGHRPAARCQRRRHHRAQLLGRTGRYARRDRGTRGIEREENFLSAQCRLATGRERQADVHGLAGLHGQVRQAAYSARRKVHRRMLRNHP